MNAPNIGGEVANIFVTVLVALVVATIKLLLGHAALLKVSKIVAATNGGNNHAYEISMVQSKSELS